MHLTFKIAFRLSKVCQANRFVIQSVQQSEIIHEGFAKTPRCSRRKFKACGRITTKNDSLDWIHDVERRAEHRRIIAKEQNFRSRRVGGVEFGEHAKLAAHVMRGFYFAAEGRAAQNELLFAEMN